VILLKMWSIRGTATIDLCRSNQTAFERDSQDTLSYAAQGHRGFGRCRGVSGVKHSRCDEL
jgi:hypothetical protein